MARQKQVGSERRNVVLDPQTLSDMEFIQERLKCMTTTETMRRMAEIVADFLRQHDEGVVMQRVNPDGSIEILRFLGLPPKP